MKTNLRLMKEHNTLFEEGWLCKRRGGNLNEFKITIYGPEKSPYWKGEFELHITLTNKFPMFPPNVVFITRIYHPNIDWNTGEISYDALHCKWRSNYTLTMVLGCFIPHLLENPNPDSPLNIEAGEICRWNRKKFEDTARKFVIKYASRKKIVFQKEVVSNKYL